MDARVSSRCSAPAPAPAGKPLLENARTHIGGAVTFDGTGLFPAPRLRMLDRVSQFALAAAAQAVRDADLLWANTDRQRAGVFIGTGMGGAQSTDDGYFTLYGEGSDRVKPYSVLMAMNNAAASWIGIEYGLNGPNLTYSTACSSSAVAIGEAARRIATGEVDMMIAGGTEAPLNYGTLVAWDALKTLATADLHDPAASCKPFAKDRTGLVLGEGAAIVVLEDCSRRGRAARAFMLNSRATVFAPMPRISRDPRSKVKRPRCGVHSNPQRCSPRKSATSTRTAPATLANDAVETAAIKQVFGAHAFRIPVSSTKSMHGHLLGAAGALEFVAAVLALERQIIPPTINLQVPDPECDLDYVPGKARAGVELAAVMSNSFAFGGTNAVLICRAVKE